ncbi:YtxH domain-containing protein [Clostridium sp. P21]|uniref:YtxH domain-containing protein n=1 Tax=Clostridium muellerianum TaxID=2716538 RepID=A0A7Y0EKB2_9CLOT|nr:YtxH domain-containing protein [Clostridium muellerianum]NMM65048.1 YtxH domain-containing protein [Clostridium muellerianum]
MRGKFVTGALVGAALGMMLVPGMDRTTRKRIKRTAKYMKNMAEDAYDNMRDKMM